MYPRNSLFPSWRQHPAPSLFFLGAVEALSIVDTAGAEAELATASAFALRAVRIARVANGVVLLLVVHDPFFEHDLDDGFDRELLDLKSCGTSNVLQDDVLQG